MRSQYTGTIVVVLATIWLVIMLLRWQEGNKVRRQEKSQEFYVRGSKKQYNYRLLTWYNRFCKFKVFRGYLERLRKTMELRKPGSTRECKEYAMKTAATSWAAWLAIVLAAVIFNFSAYLIGCAAWMLYFYFDTNSSKQIEKLDNQIIDDLDNFIDLVQFHFFNTRMPDEALEAAIQETPSKLMKLHGNRMLQTIRTSGDFEEAIKDYNMHNTDYYLKAFAEVIYVIYEYGDKIVDGKMLFVSLIQDVKRDIRTESMLRVKTSNAFSGVMACIATPVLVLGLINSTMAGTFESVADLYHGTYGSVVTLLIFAVTIICYMLAKRIKGTVRVEKENAGLYEWFYKIPFMKKMIDSFMARNWGKTMKTQETLRRVGSNLEVRLYQTKRAVYFCLGFVLMLGFLIGLHSSNRVYYSNKVTGFVTTSSGVSDDEGLKMTLVGKYYVDKYKNVDVRKQYNAVSGIAPDMFFDEEVNTWFTQIVYDEMITSPVAYTEEEAFEIYQKYYKNHKDSTSVIAYLGGMSYKKAKALAEEDTMVASAFTNLDNLIASLNQSDPLQDDDESATVASGVATVLQKYQNEYFHWYELIFVFLVGVVCYMAPQWLMTFDRKALQADMENEVSQFQSVIIGLMYMERMTVEKITEWMLMFSRIFEPSLRKCMNSMPLDEQEALEQLKEDEPFEPFCRLVDSLIMTDQVGVLQAFSNLRSDRLSYQERRAMENEIAIERKKTWAQALYLVPVWAVVIMYLIAPFCIAAVSEMSSSMNAISSLQ